MKNQNKFILFILITILFIGFGCKKDKTPPVITILGYNPITTCVGIPYVDPGATATDDEDGDITDKINTTIEIDTSQSGTGHVYYLVSDNAGNTASATRTVNVIYCKK